MSGRLKDKVAIITGAARGQGEATARVFVAEGSRVVLVDLLEADLRRVAQDLGPSATVWAGDITASGAWAQIVHAATGTFGRLDILVNNAAISDHTPYLEISAERLQRVLDVNVVAPFLGVQAVLGPMLAAGSGSIVNISSSNGLRGTSQMAAYDASKWAVRGFSKSIAAEFGGQGIRCNTIHPGAIRTPMLDASGDVDYAALSRELRIPAGRVAEPEEVARASLFLASDDASYVNGAEIAVDGGWTASFVVPGSVDAAARMSQ